MTTTISVEVPADLAQKLAPLKPYWTAILRLGLQHWQASASSLTLRRQVEQLWETTGVIVPLEASLLRLAAPYASSTRITPLQVGGQPASEIIIEQRGR